MERPSVRNSSEVGTSIPRLRSLSRAAVGVSVGVGVAACVGVSVGVGVAACVGVGVAACVGVGVVVAAAVGAGVVVGVGASVGVGVLAGKSTLTSTPPERICDAKEADVVPNALTRRSPAPRNRVRRYRLPSAGEPTDVALPVAPPWPAVRRKSRAIVCSSPAMRKPPVPTSSRKNTRG
jgi:hypothetical protein